MEQSPVIKVEKLTKVYRTGFMMKPFSALNGISFKVDRNELYGFLGPNGAGKTTTIKVLNSVVFPTEGKVELFGDPLASVDRGRIGFLPEHPYFYEYLTAREFLYFCGSLFGMRREMVERKVEELLKTVGLKKSRDTQLRKFSKGMLQRIGLAQALINDPELVILDEPMSGLDPIGRMEIRELIRDLKSRGKTVFFSSHIISDVELLADRVCILNEGEKVADGAIPELLGEGVVKYYEFDIRGVGDPGEMRDALGDICLSMTVRDDSVTVRVPGDEYIDRTVDVVRACGGRLKAVIPVRVNLEELFVDIIGENEH
jgi:ABC-2 type transport system ATP-binding protein